jgi:hypothetical protein
MEYQGFVVDAFERDPGKWRAKISRSSGKPVITGRKNLAICNRSRRDNGTGGLAHGP